MIFEQMIVVIMIDVHGPVLKAKTQLWSRLESVMKRGKFKSLQDGEKEDNKRVNKKEI